MNFIKNKKYELQNGLMATCIGQDDWSRFLFTFKLPSNKQCTVVFLEENHRMYSYTSEGEPDCPLRQEYQLSFDAIYTYDDSVTSDVFDNDSQLGMLEIYGRDIEKVLSINNSTLRRVWTVVDSDGELYYTAGYHLVDRVHYVITKENWKDSLETYKYN